MFAPQPPIPSQPVQPVADQSVVVQQDHLYQHQQQPLHQQVSTTVQQQPLPPALEQQLRPVIEPAPPLTPPASECSSDVENNNPNSQPTGQNHHHHQRDKEVQTAAEQAEVKSASYTYDTLMVADGRSKNRKTTGLGQTTQAQNPASEGENEDPPEISKTGRYVCSECGRFFPWRLDDQGLFLY